MSTIGSTAVLSLRMKKPAKFAAFAFLTMTVAACQTTEQQRYADHQTCYGIGTSVGTSGHTACMLQQQQRRDDAQLRQLEQTRLSYEISGQVQDIIDRQKSR